jgi:uncharacterized repeat protein (TIGR03803 family)
MDPSCNASIQVGDALYGTRFSDPAAGCVFRTDKDGSGYTALHIFGGRRGYGPDGLVAVDGVLYGLTTWGGPDYRPWVVDSCPGYGVLYRLNVDGSGFGVVHHFTRADGPSPHGAMACVGGMLYGTTSETIFRVRPDGNGFATVYTFGATDGMCAKADDVLPGGGLLAVNGILYGARVAGRRDRRGSIFSFDTSRGRFQTLHTFKGPEGRRPRGPLVLRNRMLYGMTEAGGRYDAGVTFQLPVGGGPIKILAERSGTDAEAAVTGLALGVGAARVAGVVAGLVAL